VRRIAKVVWLSSSVRKQLAKYIWKIFDWFFFIFL